MKKKITSIILGAAALFLMSFAISTDDEQVHYTIIQHEGLSVTVHDTIVSIESGYSIQDYVEDLGLSLENLEIFDVSDGDSEFVSSDTEIWFFNTSEDGNTNSTIEINIEDYDGDMGNIEMEEMIQELIEQEGLEGEKVMIKTIMITGDEDTEWNSEESEEDANEWIEDENEWTEEIESEGGNMDVRVEKTIDEDGNEVTLMWVNGEEVDPETFEGNLQFLNDGDVETIFIEADGASCSQSFTIGIISPAPTEENKSTDATTSNIHHVGFRPINNNEFQLSFKSDERSRTEIAVYDISGKVIFSENLGNFMGDYNNTISLNGMSSGTYVLNIIQNGERVVKKIIKQ